MTDYEKERWRTTISSADEEAIKIIIEELQKKGFAINGK